MKTRIISCFIAAVIVIFDCIILSATEEAAQKDKRPDWVRSGRVVKASGIPKGDYAYLAAWLDKNAKPARQYFIDLFAKHQVVILSEEHNVKEHKDFIIGLIPMLYHEAGVRCIGWEFSWYSQNERLEELISAPSYDDEAILQFARDYSPSWNSKEHWEIIKAVWNLNKSLKPGSEKMCLVGLPDYVDVPRSYILLKTKSADSPEFQEMLKKEGIKYDTSMAQHVEEEILQKGLKGLVFVGLGHDWMHYQYPPEATFGISFKSMGGLLKEKHGDKVFQVRTQCSADPSFIEQLMNRGNHACVGFNMQDSPFANILVPVGKGAPDVPWSRLACGYVYLGPRSNFHKNTPIKGFVTEEMFKKYKRYYEIDYGRTFKDAEDVDEYLQAHRWPKPY